MKLITQEIAQRLPALYATEELADPMVQVKFFYPDFHWTWYAIEFDGVDLFFGYVDGEEAELGYFRLSELLVNRGIWGLPVERDLHFTPCPLSEVRARVEMRRSNLD